MQRSRHNPPYEASGRSPREQSPHYDYRDDRRGSSARGGERRRSIPDARTNQAAFNSNRDRDSTYGRDSVRDFPSRDPPRGPKALDPPTGPRASNYGSDFGFRGDFRGEFRGRGRGRGSWRDDSRDRGRDADRDFRERRDDRGPQSFRDDRGRDRWAAREPYRGSRRASSPQNRGGRSPNYTGGARDNRDVPPSLDIDRTRRRSRDGPLSGGSPASDSLPSFGRGYARPRGSRGRGRGGYYGDEYGRPARSRSPDARQDWSRRTQPSATPPPQVPAFGSTTNNAFSNVPSNSLPTSKSVHIPTAPSALSANAPLSVRDNLASVPQPAMQGANAAIVSPLPGIPVPTAPRMFEKKDGRIYSNHRTPMQLVVKKDPIGQRLASGSPVTTGHATAVLDPVSTNLASLSRSQHPVVPSEHNLAATMSPGLKGQHTNLDEQTLEIASLHPQTSLSLTQYTTPRIGDSVDASQSSFARPTQRRRAILVRLPPKAPTPDQTVPDDPSESDSGDELSDEYLEGKISDVQIQITELVVNNPLEPPERLPSVFLQPFVDYDIRDLVDASSRTLEELDADIAATGQAEPEVKKEVNPEKAIVAGTVESNSLIRALDDEQNLTPTLNGESTTVTNNGLIRDFHTQHSVNTTSPMVPRNLATANSVANTLIADEKDIPQLSTELAQDPSFTAANPPRKSVPLNTLENNDDDFSETEILDALKAVRRKMATPPLSSLPKLNVNRWDQDENFLHEMKTLERIHIVAARIKLHLEETKNRRQVEQEAERKAWAQRYFVHRKWTDFSADLTAVRSREHFAASRAKATAAAMAPAPAVASARGVKPEGSRRTGSRFATEHDIDRVMRESLQEEKAREARAVRKKTANAKEATIPDMAWDKEEWREKQFNDTSHKVAFERSFAILEFGEPIDNFTEEESQIFERVYLENPKQWTNIAKALPNRDYKACIQHYYLIKHESSLKEKLKKQSRKRKGRQTRTKKTGGNGLIADLSNGNSIRDGIDDAEEGENGEKRRPKRAAAPVWPFETPASESEVASPAPIVGRKPAAGRKDAGGDNAPAKRKTKTPREKVPKQPKSSQLLAAAPIALVNLRDESPATPATPAPANEWSTPTRRDPVSAPTSIPRSLSHYDGATDAPYPTQYISAGPIMAAIPSPFDLNKTPQPYSPQTRLDSAPPIFSDSQISKNSQPTSSYWSVPECTDFPALLRHFGTDWSGIAKHMTSKTQIMVYTTNLSDWLAVPLDSNKSRRVANIMTQVKNYYQRQVDSGKMKEWEDIAAEADGKRARGESTGPLPNPTMIPKRRYDLTPGTIQRAGSSMDLTEDSPNSRSPTIFPRSSTTSYMSPTSAALNAETMKSFAQQPASSHSLNQRFPTLAQANPVSQTLPQQPPNIIIKNQPQQAVQQGSHQPQQHQRHSRGPPLGTFNTESSSRPILQADSVSQRSLKVAQQAQMEQESALRLQQQSMARDVVPQRDQRDQSGQQALLESLKQEQQRAQQQQLQMGQIDQQRDQRDHRSHQLKQEAPEPRLQQYEPYGGVPSSSSAPPSSRIGNTVQSRSDIPSSQLFSHPQPQQSSLVEPRRSVAPQQYNTQQAQHSQQPDRNYRIESHRASEQIRGSPYAFSRELKASPSPAISRPAMSASNSQDSYSALQAPPLPGPAAVAAVRQQETVRKTSSIMSLLNDEPGDTRPTPVKRVSDVSSASLQPSRTPPPPTSNLSSQQSSASQSASYLRHSTLHVSQAGQSHLTQQLSSPGSSSQPGQPYHTPSSHSYSQSGPHSLHHHTSSIGQTRSYTPTSHESRPFGPPAIQQQQQMYTSRTPLNGQQPSIRRESSLNEVHNVSSGYSRTADSSQPTMRLKESPYSVGSSQAHPSQQSRQSASSPVDLHGPEHDYYHRGPSNQYHLQPQQGNASHASPHLGPAYPDQSRAYQSQAQPPQQAHRQLAFGQAPSHTASPPPRYASQQALHRPRQDSFDSRHAPTSTPESHQPSHNSAPSVQGYSHARHHQPGPPYQPSRSEQYDHNYENEKRLQQQRQYHERLEDEQRRLEESRRR